MARAIAWRRANDAGEVSAHQPTGGRPKPSSRRPSIIRALGTALQFGCGAAPPISCGVDTHAMIYGHFRPRRHLMSADQYRRARAKAFQVWRQETCAQVAA